MCCTGIPERASAPGGARSLPTALVQGLVAAEALRVSLELREDAFQPVDIHAQHALKAPVAHLVKRNLRWGAKRRPLFVALITRRR